MSVEGIPSSRRQGLIYDRRAQSAVWGLLTIFCLMLLAAGLVDVYRLFSIRNWAYSVAQEAAMIGASRGRDWSRVATSGNIQLNPETAWHEAEQSVAVEMRNRAISDYQVEIRVLADPAGGEIPGFPPMPVRLGVGRGHWSSNQPAVGVYVRIPVDWLFLDSFGITPKSVSVFASAGVAQ